MHGYSKCYDAALALAARAHRAQTRKGSDTPYLVHPVHVSVILLRHGFSEEIAIAGLLHDVVEDQDIPLEEIEAAFGPAVAEMVAALTERKHDGEGERPWQVRKKEALAQLRRASREAVAVKAADVLHNAHSLATQLRDRGPSIWRFYSRGPGEALWYFRSVAALVRERLGAHPLVAEIDEAIEALEQAIAETGDH
jgi:(p)ppGpp synthase/HD superfamily hydrolase